MNANRETLLDVMGMSCPSCVSHINKALRDVEGVASVEVRMQDGRVLVRHDAGAAPIDTLIEALGEVGYEASPSAAA